MAKSVSVIDIRYIQNNGKTILRPQCRVCLKKDGILPIFGDEAKPDISMEISIFGCVQVQETDDLPKFICEDCFKLLEGAISFRKMAKRADTLLRRRKRSKKVEAVQSQSNSLLKTETENVKFEVTETVQMQSNSLLKTETENVEYEVTVLVPVHAENEDRTQDLNPDFFLNQDVNKIDFVSVEMEETINDNESYNNHEVLDETVSGDHNADDNEVIIPLPASAVKKPSLYNCKYCSESFQSADQYEQHRTTVEHKRNYVMSFLPKKKSKNLSSQGQKTKNPKDHFCEFCNRDFTKVHYPRHMLTEHKIKIDTSHSLIKKECTICNKMFHPAALNNHMKRIHGSGNDMKPKIKLECPVCKKLFSKHFYPLHLQRHKQGDTRNYVCDQCGKKFFFKSSFFTHRLIHTNALPHKCEYCPYRGRTKELLKIHVRTHTGDYPYKCTQCETRCSTKSNLNSHMRRHRGPVDFICNSCSRGFYSKIQLERHISVSHYGVKNHICSVCGAAFGYRHGLMSHQRKVHKRPKGLGKPKAVYLQLEEEGLLPPEPQQV